MEYIYVNDKFICAFGFSKYTEIPIFYDEYECNHEIENPDIYNPTLHELVKTFDSPAWKKAMNEKIKELKKEIVEIREKKIDRTPFLNYNDETLALAIIDGLFITGPIEERKKKIEWIEKLLYIAKKPVEGESIQLSIERAKTVPISNFINFDRNGFAKCIYHNERTSSMKYYPKSNHIFCFGCQKNADVIDVVRVIHNLSFKEALNYVLK